MEIHGFVLRRYCNSRLYMQAEMFRMEVQKNLPSHISLAFSLRLKRSDLPSPEKGVFDNENLCCAELELWLLLHDELLVNLTSG